MLVLTRKLQERICIGDQVVVTVLRVKGNTVRLGIEAPQDVQILRGELPRFEDQAGEGEAEAESPRPECDEPEQGVDESGPPAAPATSLADRVQQRVRQLAESC